MNPTDEEIADFGYGRAALGLLWLTSLTPQAWAGSSADKPQRFAENSSSLISVLVRPSVVNHFLDAEGHDNVIVYAATPAARRPRALSVSLSRLWSPAPSFLFNPIGRTYESRLWKAFEK
jgi:hypothetical protein